MDRKCKMITCRLSNNQERYFLAEKFTDKNYALPVSYLVQGPLDVNRLRSSLTRVMKVHDIFRLQITKNNDGEIIQKLKEQFTIDVDCWDKADAPKEYIDQKINDYFYSKDDILDVPLVKFQVIKLSNDKSVFTFSIHHIICDGISIEIFLQELGQSWSDPLKYEMRPKSSFLDCLAKNNLISEPSDGESDFWKQYLLGSQEVNVPPDKELSRESEFACSSALIEYELSRNLELVSKKIGVSKFNIVYTAYNFLLSRYSGSEEIITTFQSAGRRMLKNADTVMGLFSNALILRTNLNSNQTFNKVCVKTRHDIRNCLANERLPYHKVISESGLHPKYGFNWYPSSHEFNLDGLTINKYGGTRWQSDYKINLHCTESNENVNLDLHYDLNVFTEKRVSIFLEQMVNILIQITANINIKLSEINLISQFDSLLSELSKDNLIRNRSDNDNCIYDAFIEKAKLQPNQTALRYGKQSWTYSQVDDISKTLSAHLASLKLSSFNKIAILSDRTPALVISMLGVLRAGGAFAVLDNSYPPARINECLNVLQPDLLIDCTILGQNSSIIERQDALSVIRIPHNMMADNFSLSGDPNFKDVRNFTQDSTAYYLFTSGTTGKPKCVETTHSPLVHFTKWQISHFSICKDDKVTLLSGIAHDPVLRDIFTSLSSGACLLIPDNDYIYNPRYLYTWLTDNNPTILHVTPQMCKLICGAFPEDKKLKSVKHYFTGGDFLTNDHVNKIINLSPQAKIVNFYGATETPQAVGYYQVDSNSNMIRIPIGRGISDVNLLVLTEKGDRAGYGEIGQIIVRSNFLSKGYISDSSTNIDCLNIEYKTGDYGYYRDDGEIFLIGRIDDQVKIRGYRIELNDITNHLLSITGIVDAICIAAKLENGEQRLSGYIVKDKSHSTTIDEVRNELSVALPSYMIPYYLTWIDYIPLLPNGKINRRELPKPVEQQASSEKYIKPVTIEEKNMVAKFESILQRKSISLNDTFVSLGGDSLSYVQASLVLENLIGHVPDGWNSMTIKLLAHTRHKKSIIYDVSSSIVIRALSIFLVVVGHFWLTGINGATNTLLLVAGYAFADFQLKSIEYTNNIIPIISSISKIFIPTILYSLFMAFYFDNFRIEVILMYSNFIDPNMAHGAAAWFIQVLLQILLIMAGILYLDKVRDFAIAKPYEFGITLLLVFTFSALLVPMLWDTSYLYDRVPHMKLWYFALGWVLFVSTNLRQKFLVLFLSLIIPMIIAGKYYLDIMVVLPAMTLLFIPKIKIITPLHKIFYVLAGASLFIYLTHFQFRSVLHNYLNIVNYPQLDVLVGLLGGVFIWYCWGYFSNVMVRTIMK